MTFKSLFGAFLAISLFSELASAGSMDHKSMQLTLLVSESEASMSSIVEKVEGAGGYFVYQSADRLKVKFPNANAEAILEAIQAIGPYVEFNMKRWDMRPFLVDDKAKLQAKEESLKDYMRVLRTTKKREELVPIQAEINRLILAIESLKGQIRYQTHQSKFAEMDITFKQRQRNVKLNCQVSSDFDWINGVNVGALLEDYK